MKKTLITLIALVFLLGTFWSCGDSMEKKEVKDLQITFVTYGRLAEDKKDEMPREIKSLIDLIETKEIAYKPCITVVRKDLPNETYLVEVPKDPANWIRSKLGMYDYRSLKTDYKESLPVMTAKEYLAKEGGKITDSTFDYSKFDYVFVLDQSRSNLNSMVFNNCDSLKREIEARVKVMEIDPAKKILVLHNWKGSLPDIDGTRETSVTEVAQVTPEPVKVVEPAVVKPKEPAVVKPKPKTKQVTQPTGKTTPKKETKVAVAPKTSRVTPDPKPSPPPVCKNISKLSLSIGFNESVGVFTVNGNPFQSEYDCYWLIAGDAEFNMILGKMPTVNKNFPNSTRDYDALNKLEDRANLYFRFVCECKVNPGQVVTVDARNPFHVICQKLDDSDKPCIIKYFHY
jgi:hypothetical protein